MVSTAIAGGMKYSQLKIISSNRGGNLLYRIRTRRTTKGREIAYMKSPTKAMVSKSVAAISCITEKTMGCRALVNATRKMIDRARKFVVVRLVVTTWMAFP